MDKNYTDIVIIGAGHAGCEAGFAAAKLGLSVLMITISLDNIALLACNPSIGGTAKGHLVREIDALGGQIGLAADSTLLQLKMLNSGKGAAVQSLRAQTDKNKYHVNMKSRLESEQNIKLLSSEVTEILCGNDGVTGVRTNYGETFYCGAIIVASGVYLNSRIITGTYSRQNGPQGFSSANALSDCLKHMGFELRRFKTGTPARADAKSLNFNKMIRQDGDREILPFSFMNDFVPHHSLPCYLTYTNEQTHKIIRENLHLAPMYSGEIKGTGTRYCPSIEDKIVRFADKDKHQVFVEPEGAETSEVYLQGLSTSLPAEVQHRMYSSIEGMENIRITRYAYAIEYDCIDSTELNSALAAKRIKGLYFAGQINGSSGYEEAAAQGLIAGINAAHYLLQKPQFVLSRHEAYIGVLIDDLVIKGTNEPYRMMTARAENRLGLRQDNADIRLTQKGRDIGLVDDARYEKFCTFKTRCQCLINRLERGVSPQQASDFFTLLDMEKTQSSYKLSDILKRPQAGIDELLNYFGEELYDSRVRQFVQAEVKYGGYLLKQEQALQRLKKLEDSKLPEKIDYMTLSGLRIEARQKLNKIRPANIAEASRISGVSPADIAVLMLYLKSRKG